MNKNIVVLGAVAGLSLASATAHAQALRPNILVWLDTSGSMLYSQSLDGSPLCNTSMQNTTNGQMSRVYNMKNAIRAALAQVGTDEANFGLARFPQLELRDIASFGGWKDVQAKHFADGGIFDQIYVPK